MLKPRVDILLSEYEKLKEYEKMFDTEFAKWQRENPQYDNVRRNSECEDMEENKMLKQKLDSIKFYIEQSDIKDMLWGKEILDIIGDE